MNWIDGAKAPYNEFISTKLTHNTFQYNYFDLTTITKYRVNVLNFSFCFFFHSFVKKMKRTVCLRWWILVHFFPSLIRLWFYTDNDKYLPLLLVPPSGCNGLSVLILASIYISDLSTNFSRLFLFKLNQKIKKKFLLHWLWFCELRTHLWCVLDVVMIKVFKVCGRILIAR